MRKLYRPLYAWGQLSGWFKQTVNDPTASLSAERRGTVSLPDIESCFAGKTRYTAKVGWGDCRLGGVRRGVPPRHSVVLCRQDALHSQGGLG